jgi:methyl-accepting chemotaxis protein
MENEKSAEEKQSISSVRVVFTFIWWIGFLIAVGLMIWFYIDTNAVSNKNIFLIVGVTHMTFLVIFGFWVILKREEDNVEVASRVSTMGYLHTLIGTSIALIQMASITGSINGHLKEILIPIGSALLTSIIGWAFAKEMERDRYRFISSSQEEIDNSLDFLATKIRKVGMNLEATSVGWEKSIDHTINKLITSTERLDYSIKTVEEGFVNSVKSVEKQFIKNIQTLENGLSNNMQKVEDDFSKSAKTSEEFLNNLHSAFQKTFEQMGEISTEWNKHLVALEKFSQQADGSLEELFKNSKQIATEVTLVAKTLPSATNIIKEVDTLIALLRERDGGGL